MTDAQLEAAARVQEAGWDVHMPGACGACDAPLTAVDPYNRLWQIMPDGSFVEVEY